MTRVLDTTSSITTSVLDPAPTTDGSARAGSRALGALAGLEVGVWEMTPGTTIDVETDEVFVVLSGSASVSFHDGEVIDLAPGTVVRLREGDRTTWTVHETLRKMYVA